VGRGLQRFIVKMSRPASPMAAAYLRPASARPASAALAQKPSSTLPRATLQRPISAMGRPIAADLTGTGRTYRAPQNDVPPDVPRPASALGLTKHGLPDFRPPPTQCPTKFDRKGYAGWEREAVGKKAEDISELMDAMSSAPLKERRRPGQIANHVAALKPKFEEISEFVNSLPENDKTRKQIEDERAIFFKSLEECLPLALVPPPDYEEEKAEKLAEWEASIGGLKEPKKEEPKTKFKVDEGPALDPTGSLGSSMLTQFRAIESLAAEVYICVSVYVFSLFSQCCMSLPSCRPPS
jgi:hypothetical protein